MDVLREIIEVKPKKQCFPPKEPKRKTRKYKQQVLTYIINQAKFKSLLVNTVKTEKWVFEFLPKTI